MALRLLTLLPVAAIALAGCTRAGDIVEGGIQQVRSACPAVGIPAGTGDITTFTAPGRTDAASIDVTAAITNVRSTCTEGASEIVTNVTFDVVGRRSTADGAREVVLPYYTAVVQGGTAIVSKRTSRVALRFEPGQLRAQASVVAGGSVSRAAATLPQDIERQITQRRKAGEQDAAVDPLSIPAVRQAVLRATFEVLVGFQLTDDQLRYNATR